MAEMRQVSSGSRGSPLGPFRRGVLFKPTGEGAHEVLSADLSFPFLGFAASRAGSSGVVGRLLEDDFRHNDSSGESESAKRRN